MPLAKIEQMLKEHMGLNAASIGSSAIKRAVQIRMQARGIEAPDDYLQKLRGSPSELTELIELVVVPETWFYRDSKPFEALAEYARKHWLKRRSGTPVRLLSVPCSSGEEPYTMAMTLLDAGMMPDKFQIDAVDISETNLNRARKALYRDNSFRSDDLSFRNRHFIHNEAGYLLNADIRRQVRFIQGNLLAAGFLAGEQPYQAVFCRNLLIYFDRETQARALQVIERHLEKPGLLFLGHAEGGVIGDRDFVALDVPRSFAYVYGGERAEVTWEDSLLFDVHCRPAPQSKPAKRARKAQPVAPRTPVEPVVEAAEPCLLDQATALANSGHLVEAAALCERALETRGPDAQTFYLLALLREAVGECDAAETYLRKALYLVPDHYEALTHIALLLERKGDIANAELMRQRAKRSYDRQQAEAARSVGGK